MTCPSCGHDNPVGTKFCGECGSALAAVCPNCSAVNPPGNKFCGECGTSLGAAPAAAQPATAPTRTERRLVSVLFADLVGYTAFSESRDPEEVRAMLTRYYERSREILERFAGTVDKYIGDAVMAWWGAIAAREDDAERAVRAALELVGMVSELGAEIGVPDLALRAGVLTGEAAVGPGGNEQGVLVGDLVNTASRLQSIADPGTVVVGESTRALVAEAVEFEALGERQVKGKEIPVKPYRALRVVAERGGRGRSEGLEPPFVGRQEELRLLKDQLHAAGRERRARLVSVVGDAGIGKSRLAWELLKYLDGIAETVFWHQGRSPAYGDGIALWSLAEMVRGRAGIAADDDKGKARLKLRTSVAEHVPVETDRQWIEPRLAGLLGLDPMPPGDRDELFAAIRTFFHRISEKGTVVLAFEDLQWADGGVLEFLTDLVERSAHHPILIITMARPELLDRHPGWGSGRRNQLSLHLSPLPDADMRELVVGMAPGIPDEAAAAVVARAAGIPLYAVEFVRMLIGSGDLERTGDGFILTGDVGELTLPDSLAAVIGARLDRLDAGDRELIQDAAVLGQSFTIRGLAAVRETETDTLRPDLDRLVRQELLTLDEDPRSPERGQFRFVQGVIREVAYGRLAKSDRHERHRRVAEYFSGLDDPELAGVVASHFLAAHETAPAGTEGLLERGRAALLGAAERAEGLHANAQALALYRQALGLGSIEPAERASILLRAARAAGWGDLTEAVATADQALAAMEAVGDADGALGALTAKAWVLNSNFHAGDAVTALEPTYLGIDEFDTPARVALGLEMARAYMLASRGEDAVAASDRVLPRAEWLASPAEVVDGIVTRGSALAFLGRTAEGHAALHGAIALADQNGLHLQAIRARNNLATDLSFVDPLTAVRISEELYALTRRVGRSAWMERATSDLADWYLWCGRFDESLDLIADEAADLNPFDQGARRLSRLLVDALRDGDGTAPAAIRATLDEYFGDSLDVLIADEVRHYKARSHWLEGDWGEAYEVAIGAQTVPVNPVALDAAARLGDPEKVARVQEALDAKMPRGRLRDALTLVGSGVSAALGGDRDRAADTFRSGLDLLEQIALPVQLVQTQALVAHLVGLDHPDAFAAATRAKGWLREVGALGLERVLADALPPDEVADRRAG